MQRNNPSFSISLGGYTCVSLRSGLVLGGHPVANRHSRVLPTSLLLLLLEILVVGHLLLLFVCHIAGVHTRGSRDTRLLGIDVAVAHIFGSLSRNIGGINAILVGSRVGSVEAGLGFRGYQSHAKKVGMSKSYLDKVLSFWLRHQWLQLGSCEGVDETGLGHNQKKDLGSSKDGEFVCLLRDRIDPSVGIQQYTFSR